MENFIFCKVIIPVVLSNDSQQSTESGKSQSPVDPVFTATNLMCRSKTVAVFYISCDHWNCSHGVSQEVRPVPILASFSILVSNAITFEFMKKTPFF